MHNRRGEECPWTNNPEAETDLNALHVALNCATVQGCDQCVSCSERALDLFRKAARQRAATR